MHEIEIKFNVDSLDDIKETMLKLGCVFSDELNQKDTIFVPDINDIVSEEGKTFVRIRSVNGTVEVTLKKKSSNLMQSKEIEFEASDFNKVYDFLETLGLNEWVTVEKKRITTKYKDFNICMDEVHRLGSFIEIEVVTTEEDKSDYYEKEILKLCEELDINKENRVNNFYDTMIDELNKKELNEKRSDNEDN